MPMRTRPITWPTLPSGTSDRKNRCTQSPFGSAVSTLSMRTASGHASRRPTATDTPMRPTSSAIHGQSGVK